MTRLVISSLTYAMYTLAVHIYSLTHTTPFTLLKAKITLCIDITKSYFAKELTQLATICSNKSSHIF